MKSALRPKVQSLLLIEDTPSLQVMMPQGAMYAIVRIHTDQLDETIQSDLDFTKLLLEEENVLVLPGTCFGLANAFRVVFCASIPVLEQAADRIHQFCLRHTAPK